MHAIAGLFLFLLGANAAIIGTHDHKQKPKEIIKIENKCYVKDWKLGEDRFPIDYLRRVKCPEEKPVIKPEIKKKPKYETIRKSQWFVKNGKIYYWSVIYKIKSRK